MAADDDESDIDWDVEDEADECEAIYEAEKTRAGDDSSQVVGIHEFSAGAQRLAERMRRQLDPKTPIDRISALHALLRNDNMIYRLAEGVDCSTSGVCLVLAYLASSKVDSV